MRENQVVFMMSVEKTPVNSDVAKFLVLGVPKAAWEYMQHGRTHTFDLRAVGLPTQLVLFGEQSHARVVDTMSVFTGSHVKVDTKTDYAVPEDEQAIPRMVAAARKYLREKLFMTRVEDFTDVELRGLIDAILKGPA